MTWLKKLRKPLKKVENMKISWKKGKLNIRMPMASYHCSWYTLYSISICCRSGSQELGSETEISVRKVYCGVLWGLTTVGEQKQVWVDGAIELRSNYNKGLSQSCGGDEDLGWP